MHRVTPRDTGFRAYHGAARGTVDKASDDPLMQTVDAGFMRADSRRGVERWQNYGFTSVILPRDQGQGRGQGQGAAPKAGELGPAKSGKSAEALMIFAGGSRSHPVAAVVDDRRHRLQKLKPGEVALFDDQTQQVHLARDGVFVSLPSDKKFEVRVQKQGDQVKPAGGSSAGGANSAKGGPGQYGQTAWLPKTPHALHAIDKDARTVKHPGQILHQITQAGNLQQVLHQSVLEKTAGLLHSINSGAEILKMLPSGGISLESAIKVAHKAPSILQDGPVSMLKTLAVTQGVTAAGFTTSSSRSIKRDFAPPRHGLATLRRLRVTEYSLKVDPGRRILGFVAQQVRRHFPLAVSLVRGARRRHLAVDQGQMLALAVRAIQELDAEVRALRAEVSRLPRRA